MRVKETKHIIKGLFKKLNKPFREIQKTFDKDAIHTFRVQTKKLRSLLRLLSSSQENGAELKLPKKIKKAYSALGKIRDIQLQLKEIKETCKKTSQPDEYLSILKKELKQRKKEFERGLKKNQLSYSRKKIYRKLPLKLPYKNICQFLHQKIASILALVNAGLSDDIDLHSTRKNIKDIIYINEIYKEALKRHDQPELLNKGELKKAAALADELGKFIDKWVSMSLLQPGWLKKIGPEERKQLQSICSRWEIEKRSIRKHVSGKLKAATFFSQVDKQ